MESMIPRHKNNRPVLRKTWRLFLITYIRANRLSVAPSLSLYYHPTAFMSNIYSITNVHCPQRQLLHPALLITSTNPNLSYLKIIPSIFFMYVSKFSHTQSIQIIFYKANNFSSSSISLPISISISRILAIISDVGGYSTGTYSTSLYLLILRS